MRVVSYLPQSEIRLALMNYPRCLPMGNYTVSYAVFVAACFRASWRKYARFYGNCTAVQVLVCPCQFHWRDRVSRNERKWKTRQQGRTKNRRACV